MIKNYKSTTSISSILTTRKLAGYAGLCSPFGQYRCESRINRQHLKLFGHISDEQTDKRTDILSVRTHLGANKQTNGQMF